MSNASLPSPLALNSVHALFVIASQSYPDRAFINVLGETAKAYGIEEGEISYARMGKRISHLITAYSKAGYGLGHRVGLLVENRPEFFEHWFALNALGASLVPINPDLRSAELKYLVEHSELIMAVAIASRHKDLRDAGVRHVIEPSGTIAQVMHKKQSGTIDQNTEAALLYTSGTTGLPKGCILTNAYFLNCGEWYKNVGGACEISEASERMITPLPLFHMNAMACSTMAMLSVGGCLSVVDRFHPTSWWASVRKANATIMHYLGVMPAMLMNDKPDVNDTKHNLRFGFGAGVEKSLHAPFEKRFGVPLVEAWAMTETGNGAAIIASHGDRRVGTSCFGTPTSDIEVKLIADNGEEVGGGEPGELLVRRAGGDPRFGFFDRYLKDPKETENAWRDGWFHTGDIVQQNPDGSMVFVDRKKNVIRRSGENIAAIEVEGVLNHHQYIAACAVGPTPDAVRGDEVFACIQLYASTKDGQATAQSIVDYCLDQLAYYKAPGYIAFVDGLPLTSTNKIQRGAMKQLIHQLRSNANTIDCRHMKKRSTR